MEEVCISIDSQDDVVHHGVLEIALPDDCRFATISHAELQFDEATQSRAPSRIRGEGDHELVKKLTMEIADLAPKTRVTCVVWLVIGGDTVGAVEPSTSQSIEGDAEGVASPAVVALAAALRYDAGATPTKRRTEIRRSERVFQVARPLVETVRLKRVDATRVFVAVALTCSNECAVRIRDYALDCNPAVTALSDYDDARGRVEARVKVEQDPNAHVRNHRVGRNETLHLAFALAIDGDADDADRTAARAVLRAGIEFDGDNGGDGGVHKWRTTSLLNIPLASVFGAAYQIDVRPKVAPGRGCSAGEEVVFVVSVTRVDYNGDRGNDGDDEEDYDPHNVSGDGATAPRLLLCLAATSEGDWVLLGKQREAFRFDRRRRRGDGARAFSTTKRLLPLRVGRLRAPQFALRRGDADDHALLEPARVFCGQLATTLLVV